MSAPFYSKIYRTKRTSGWILCFLRLIACAMPALAAGVIWASDSAAFEIEAGRRFVSLKTGAQTFSVGDKRGGWLGISGVAEPKTYPAAASESRICMNAIQRDYPPGKTNPGWYYFDWGSIETIKIVKDFEGDKQAWVRMKTWPGVNYRMDAELSLKKGFPCLFVRQSLLNLTGAGHQIDFGNYMCDIQQYAFDTNMICRYEPKESHAFKNVKSNYFWIWVKKSDNGTPAGKMGMGIISLKKTFFCLVQDVTYAGSYRMFWGYDSQIVRNNRVTPQPGIVGTKKGSGYAG